MAVWVRSDADGTYSAEFPVAGGRRCRITVGEDEFADEEFAKGLKIGIAKGDIMPVFCLSAPAKTADFWNGITSRRRRRCITAMSRICMRCTRRT